MSLQINDVSYAGKFASQYWTPAFYGMDTLKKGVVNVIDNIKKRINIGNIDFAGGLQPRQPTPNSASHFATKSTVPNRTTENPSASRRISISVASGV